MRERADNERTNLTESARIKLEHLNWADVLLYQHFLNKFNQLVNDFGAENMNREVEQLKTMIDFYSEECRLRNVSDLNGDETNDLCWALTLTNNKEFTDFLINRQMQMFPDSGFIKT